MLMPNTHIRNNCTTFGEGHARARIIYPLSSSFGPIAYWVAHHSTLYTVSMHAW